MERTLKNISVNFTSNGAQRQATAVSAVKKILVSGATDADCMTYLAWFVTAMSTGTASEDEYPDLKLKWKAWATEAGKETMTRQQEEFDNLKDLMFRLIRENGAKGIIRYNSIKMGANVLLVRYVEELVANPHQVSRKLAYWKGGLSAMTPEQFLNMCEKFQPVYNCAHLNEIYKWTYSTKESKVGAGKQGSAGHLITKVVYPTADEIRASSAYQEVKSRLLNLTETEDGKYLVENAVFFTSACLNHSGEAGARVANWLKFVKILIAKTDGNPKEFLTGMRASWAKAKSINNWAPLHEYTSKQIHLKFRMLALARTEVFKGEASESIALFDDALFEAAISESGDSSMV